MAEDDDQSLLDIDPEKLTIPKLKSKLAELGVQLSMKNEKKVYYVDKFKELQDKKRKEMEAKKRPVPDTKEVDVDRSKKAKVDKETTPEKKTPSKSKRKSNIFQSGSSTAEGNKEEETPEQPKKKSLTAETPIKEPEVKATPVKVPPMVEPVQTPKVKEPEIETPKFKEPTRVQEPVHETPAKEEPVKPAPVSFQFATPSRFAPTPKRHEPEPLVFTSSPPKEETPRISEPSTSTPLYRDRRTSRQSIATTASTPTETEPSSVRRRPRVSIASIPTTSTSYDEPSSEPVTTTSTPSYIPRRRRPLGEISATSQAAAPVPTTTTTATTPITSSRRTRRPTSPTNSPPSGTVSVDQYMQHRVPSLPSVEPPAKEDSLINEVEVEGQQTIWQWLYLSTVLVVWLLLIGMLIFNGPLGGRMPSFLTRTKFCDTFDVRKDCVRCPEHGTCEGGNLVCDANYVRSRDTCVLDATLDRNARKMFYIMEDYLQRRNGEFDCGYGKKQVLDRDMIAVLLSKGYSEGDVKKYLPFIREAILPTTDSVRFSDGEWYSNDKIIPWGCAIRNLIWDLKWHICALLIVVGMVLYAIQKKKEADQIVIQAQNSVKDVYNMLQEQALHARSPDEAYVAVTHLRDSVLKPPINPVKRDKIWKHVEEVIKSDTRVQEQTLLHHGEQQTVWEWTAPVRATGLFSPPHLRTAPVDYNMGVTHDEGSTTAVEKRYPDLFPSRTFRDVSHTPL